MRDRERLQEIGEVTEAVEAARGVSWYGERFGPADVAVARLCLLRRSGADILRGAEAGDADVRRALEDADVEAVVWLASRVISYMDEHGFPELVEGLE